MFLKSKVFFAENAKVKVTKHCLKLQGWDVMFRSNLKWIKRRMEIDLMMNFSVGSVRMQQWKMRHLQSLSLTKCRRHRLTTGDETGGSEYNLKCWLMMDYWWIPFHFMMERWYVKTSRLSRVLKSKKKESSTRWKNVRTTPWHWLISLDSLAWAFLSTFLFLHLLVVVSSSFLLFFFLFISL